MTYLPITSLILLGTVPRRSQTVDDEKPFRRTSEQPIEVADESIDITFASRLVYDVLVVVVPDATA